MNSSRWFAGISFAAFLTVVHLAAAAEPRSAGSEWTETERWVAEQVGAGKPADLSKKFPNEEQRKVSAKFLEDLLTGAIPGVKPHRNGVQIMWATIDQPVDLENAQIPCAAWLTHCQFLSSVTCRRATFKGVALFSDSTFKAEANFNSTKVGDTAFFRAAVFEGPVNFGEAQIGGDLDADDAQFKNPEQEVGLYSIKVGNAAFFRKAVFEGPVNFGSAQIGNNLEADGAAFKNPETEANFNSMKAGHTAFFRNAVFEGPVDFGSAQIGSNLEADGAAFKNPEKKANFNSMRVEQTAFFSNAVFEGPVDFGSAQIGDVLVADGAAFKNPENGASFNSMKVGHTAFFRKVVFAGAVDFVSAQIGSVLEADGAAFKNPETQANFNSMKVEQTAFFKKVVFEGPVDFVSAEIGGNFELNEAKFRNKQKRATFYRMKVAGSVYFADAQFSGSADLTQANFAALYLSRAVFSGSLDLQAMTYKEIHADPDNERRSHELLLRLAEQADYSADVYGALEQFFTRQGYGGDANKAFIADKRRQRAGYLHTPVWSGNLLARVGSLLTCLEGLLAWLGSVLLDGLVGYGRRPWLAMIPCAFFVGFGCVLFSPEKMELQKPDDAPRVYSCFWYSLGLFLPFVDLQADKVWKPKQNQTFLRNYMRVHILLGWILIPLVLAALTGLIK